VSVILRNHLFCLCANYLSEISTLINTIICNQTTFLPPWGPVYQAGINYVTVACSWLCSSWVKLNRSGSGCPFGSVVPYSLSSSKKGSKSPLNGVGLPLGSYWSNLDTKSIDSRDVLCLNTFSHGSGRICGNLYSL